MTCNEFENRFLAGLENELSPDERKAGESHLTECTACQVLSRQLEQLDVALTLKFKAPGMSVDFSERLAKRIQASARVLSAAQREKRKRELQTEYEAGLERCRQSSLGLTGIREGLPYVVLAVLAGWLAWEFTPRLVQLPTAQGLGETSQTLLLAGVAGLVFLVIGLAALFPRQLRQLETLV